jgi:hypothetical protein
MTTQKPKSNSVISTEQRGTSLVFKVRDAGEIELDLQLVSQANRERATLHGFVQRVSDAAAIPRNTETGASATPADKLAAMQRLVDHFNSGSEEWSPTRQAGVGSDGLLLQSLMRLKPEVAKVDLEKFLEPLDKAAKAALLASSAIAPIAAELRAEAAKRSGVDVEDLLSRLG